MNRTTNSLLYNLVAMVVTTLTVLAGYYQAPVVIAVILCFVLVLLVHEKFALLKLWNQWEGSREERVPLRRKRQ